MLAGRALDLAAKWEGGESLEVEVEVDETELDGVAFDEEE